MSRYEIIDMVGVSGRVWRLSGEGPSAVMMAPKSTGLYETAVQSKYVDAAYGEIFQGLRYPSTTVTWTAQVGADLERDPEVWHSLYSDFRADLSYTDPVTFRYISSDGVRERKLRLVSEPKPFSLYDFEGGDPHKFSFGSILLTMKTELPFYVGPTVTYDWSDPAFVGDGFITVSMSNPGDVEIWPRWVLTELAEWSLPDPSFGSNAYGRALTDAGRTTLPLTLKLGEGSKVDSYPDTQTVVAENDANPQSRWSDDLTYPVQPGIKQDCTVRITNCTNPSGAELRLELPRWYLTPFSRPRITI